VTSANHDVDVPRPPWVSIGRDVTLLGITAAAWWADASLRGAAGPKAMIAAVSAGVMAAVAGFLVHEWGHLAGAWLTGSRVHFPNRVLAPLLFHFESAHNDRRQFLAMSYGGYAGSAVGLAAIAAVARLDTWSGRIALGLAGVGTLITVVAEVPTTVRVARGAPLPEGYAFEPPAS
jgi:hypothetical protein